MTDPRELLQAYLDEELTAPEREQVAAALAADPALRAELARLQAVGELVRAGAWPAMPEQMMSMIRDRVSETKRPWFERLFPTRVPYLTLGAASTAVLCVLLAPLTQMPDLSTVEWYMSFAREKAEQSSRAMTVEESIAAPDAGAAGDALGARMSVGEQEATPSAAPIFPPEPGASVMDAAAQAPARSKILAESEAPATARSKPIVDYDRRDGNGRGDEALSGDKSTLWRVPDPPERDRVPADGTRGSAGGADYYRVPVQPRPAPVENLPRLQAGEIDDNLLFGKYVEYAEKQQQEVAAHGVFVVPLRERYVIQVVDQDGVGVPDAQVMVHEPHDLRKRPLPAPLLRARTDASGQAVFFPPPSAAQVEGFSVTAYRRLAGKVYASVGHRCGRGDTSKPWRIQVKPSWVTEAGRTVDIAFLVDTTGSMSEEISRLKVAIDEVTKLLDKSAERPKLRFGMVLYRDLGDEYVTKQFEFTENVAAFIKSIGNVSADGGGDTPEHVNAALAAAVNELKWSDAPALRMAFLIGDAPPHLDYATDAQNPPYLASVDKARAKGIKFFTISSSGNDDVGEYVWRQIALLTRGKFLFITKGDALGDVPDRAPQPDDGSTPHHVERQDYTVQALPNLIEQCVRRELAALGTKPPSTIDVDLPLAPQVEPPTLPVPPTPPLVVEPVRKISFAAYLLILVANLAGWVWAWRKSRRMSLR